MTNVTLRQLRALLAIKVHGKINAAATAIGLTAPAVTLQLRQLEDDAGVALFDRTPHGMRATTAGLAYLDAAEAIFGRLAALETELEAIRGVRKGRITIGTVATAAYFAPQLVAAFSAEHPQIEADLVSGKRPEIATWLRNHEIDVVLTARPPRDISVRATPFAEYSLVLVSSPLHPLAGRKGLMPADLMGEQFVIREHGSGPRATFERFIGGDPDRLGVHYTEMNSNLSVTRAVLDDLGIALVGSHTVAPEIQASRLTILDVVGLPDQRQWFAVTRSDRAITPVIASFQDFLALHGARFVHANDATSVPKSIDDRILRHE